MTEEGQVVTSGTSIFSLLGITEWILICQTVVFTVTLVVLAYQTIQLRNSLRMSSYSQVIQNIQEIDRAVLNNPELGELLEGGDLEVPGLSTTETSFIYYFVNFWELIYILWYYNVIEDELWEPWKRHIERYLKNTKVQKLWCYQIKPRKMYFKPFRDFLDNLIDCKELIEQGEQL